METIRLLLPLENVEQQDVIHYFITCEFLKSPSYAALLKLCKLLDTELNSQYDLNTEQLDCIRYLYRDWGYTHLKKTLSADDTNKLFTIGSETHAPGHFIAAIDFAKRNPKENAQLMRFGLMLLTHSALPETITNPKIAAIEQLLANTEPSAARTYQNVLSYQRIMLLLGYNAILGLLCIWLITKITLLI